MKKIISVFIVACLAVLLVSIGMLYLSIQLFPGVAQEYISPVFRNSGNNDGLFFSHPIVVCFALKWFWERYKTVLPGQWIIKAFELASVYLVIAMLPVLWITFSAINVSFTMILTWMAYGFIQAFTAGLVYAKWNP